MDAEFNEKHGIVPFGRKGYEIQRNGKLIHIFNKHPTAEANYLDAVEYAKNENDWRSTINAIRGPEPSEP